MGRIPIRARIALAMFGLTVALLVAMSFAVFAALRVHLEENLDDALRLRAAANRQLVDLGQSPPVLNAGADPGTERAEGDAVLRLYTPEGTLAADASPVVPGSGDEARLVRAATSERRRQTATARPEGVQAFRISADPLIVDGRVVGVLVTGTERSVVDEALSALRVIFFVAVPLTAAAAGMGGYAIARRSLAPVRNITTVARDIAAGDLSRRVGAVNTQDEVG